MFIRLFFVVFLDSLHRKYYTKRPQGATYTENKVKCWAEVNTCFGNQLIRQLKILIARKSHHAGDNGGN